MIRGYFGGPAERQRPYVVGRVTMIGTGASTEVHFLVDTGADVTVLAPQDGRMLELDLRSLPTTNSTGVGGITATVIVPAGVSLDSGVMPVELHVLLPVARAQLAVPSLLGRDILSYFTLIVEERRGLVLLLTPDEADRLPLG